MQTLDSAKEWFAEHREAILESYGRKHHLQKEDLYLVIGTLDTKDYALCECRQTYLEPTYSTCLFDLLVVNHKHPDGTAHFNM